MKTQFHSIDFRASNSQHGKQARTAVFSIFLRLKLSLTTYVTAAFKSKSKPSLRIFDSTLIETMHCWTNFVLKPQVLTSNFLKTSFQIFARNQLTSFCISATHQANKLFFKVQIEINGDLRFVLLQ